MINFGINRTTKTNVILQKLQYYTIKDDSIRKLVAMLK